MTRSDYDRTRIIPERKRATLNGKRSVDSFIKTVRERMLIEHPDEVNSFDSILAVRLMMIYFYFTKYIINRWDINGMTLAMMAINKDKIWYSDNILDGYKSGEKIREKIIEYMQETIND